MVEFDPNLTEILFFDIEFFVPPSDRRSTGASLLSNPFRKGHSILGGVFYRAFPLRDASPDPQTIAVNHFWVWNEGSELALLQRIYGYFQEAWRPLRHKSPGQADLVAVGIGISRFDLPALFSRSLVHKVAPRGALYATFFHLKALDLSDVGAPLPPAQPILYPRTANQLGTHFGLPKQKSSGTRVWDLYDAGNFAAIEARTEAEVRDLVRLYKALSGCKLLQEKEEIQ